MRGRSTRIRTLLYFSRTAERGLKWAARLYYRAARSTLSGLAAFFVAVRQPHTFNNGFDNMPHDDEQQIFERAIAAAPATRYVEHKPRDISDVQTALQKGFNELFERVSQPDYVLTAGDANLLAFTGCIPSSVAVKAMAAEHGEPFAALTKACAAHLQRQIKQPKRPQTLADIGKSLESEVRADEISSGADDSAPPPPPAVYHAPGRDPINDDPDALANLGAWVSKALKR